VQKTWELTGNVLVKVRLIIENSPSYEEIAEMIVTGTARYMMFGLVLRGVALG
jgi:hypothetical protein